MEFIYPSFLDEFMNIAVTDPNGNVVFVNRKFSETLGYSEAEILGQPLSLIVSDPHAEEIFQQIKQALAQRRMWQGEMRNRTKSGRHCWVETIIIPELDENRNPKRFWSFRTDINLQKEREQNVQQLLDTIDGAYLWMIDQQYRLVIGNRSLMELIKQLFGVEQSVGTCLLDMPMSREKRAFWKNYYDRALAGEAFSEEIELPEISGTVLAFFTPVRNGAEQIIGVNICQLNISEEKKKQQFILEQNALLMEIAHLQSHKIRGPLSTILGLLNLLDQDSLDAHNQEILGYLRASCSKLDEIISTIVHKASSLEMREEALRERLLGE